MKKRIIIIALVLIVGIGVTFCSLRQGKGMDFKVNGMVEGTIVSQIAEVSGKITEMHIDLGSHVRKGDLLARIDDADLTYNLTQLQLLYERRVLALQLLRKGATLQEREKAQNDIRMAEANQRSATATAIQVEDEATRMQQLWEVGGISQHELDQIRLRQTVATEAREAATAGVLKAQEQLSLLQRGAEPETIAIAEADVKDTKSKIEQCQDALAKCGVLALKEGVVISLNYRLGSFVNPGFTIADIAVADENYVVCYVPTKYSSLINYNDEFVVSAEGHEYTAVVKYIDLKSQYTPKDWQSSATKNKVSVKVKLLLPPEATLKPSDSVSVRFKNE